MGDRGGPRGVAALSAAVARIAVVRALPGLGDLLCLTPALRALRTAHPAAHVALIGLPAAAPVVERLARGGLVDELLEFPGFPGLPEVPFDQARLDGFVAAARAREFDLALQLHGSGERSAAFTELLGARTVAGYGPRAPFLPPAYDLPEVRRPLRVLAALGIAEQGTRLELPLDAADAGRPPRSPRPRRTPSCTRAPPTRPAAGRPSGSPPSPTGWPSAASSPS